MTTVSVEGIVRRPPAKVFQFVATNHFDNHRKWDPDVLEMRQTSPGPTAAGTTATVVRRQGQRRVEGTVTVTAYEPDRLAAWDVRFGPFTLRQRAHFVGEQEGRATRLTLTIDTRATGPVRLAVPLLRRRFRATMTRSLDTIRTLLEGEQSA
jgi:hypothetical protein